MGELERGTRVVSGTSFGMVRPPCSAEFWADVAAHLARAVEHGGEYTLEQVRSRIEAGDAQLWVARDGGRILMAMVTALVEEPGGKACDVWLVGGEDHARWLSHIVTLEQWARDEGCKRMVTNCRPGWRRWLPDWRIVRVTMEKRLRGSMMSGPDGERYSRIGGKWRRLERWTLPAHLCLTQAEIDAILAAHGRAA